MIELTFKLSNRNICLNSPIVASLEFYSPRSVHSEEMWFSAQTLALGYPLAVAVTPAPTLPVGGLSLCHCAPRRTEHSLASSCRPATADTALCVPRVSVLCQGTGDCVQGHCVLQPEVLRVSLLTFSPPFLQFSLKTRVQVMMFGFRKRPKTQE